MHARAVQHHVMPTVYWFLASDGAMASSRLHGLMLDRKLRREGYRSAVLYQPPFWSYCTLASADPFLRRGTVRPGDIVVIQKLDGDETVRLIDHYNRIGAVTVYVECDWRPDEVTKYHCQHIVSPSRYLQRSMAAGRVPRTSHCIPDPIETAVRNPRVRSGRSYKIVWVGTKGNWSSLDQVRAILNEPEFVDLELMTVSDHRDATHRWTRSTAMRDWVEGDVCVIPTSNTPEACAKSNNRLTQAMALGLPVACGAIPAYTDVVVDGVNGFICRDADAYRFAFRKLRDAALRRTLALEGWRRARDEFSFEAIFARWVELFRQVSPDWDVTPRRWRDVTLWSAARHERAHSWLRFAEIGCPTSAQCGRCLIQSQIEWPFQLAPLTLALRKAGRKVGAHLS